MFRLAFGDAEERGGVWVVKILLLCGIGVRADIEGEEYVFLLCMEAMRFIDKVDETLWCVCLPSVLMM